VFVSSTSKKNNLASYNYRVVINMRINTKQVAKYITHPRILAPTLLIAVGAGKMLKDCNSAKPYEKKQIIIKDSAILAGSVAGFALMNPVTSLFCRKEVFINQVIKNTSYVIKQSLAATLNTFAGVVGAVFANEFVKKHVLNKVYFCPPPVWLEDSPEKQKVNDIFKNFNMFPSNVATKTANRVVGNISDIPSMRVLSSPMIALTGFSVANTDGYHNKLKKTTKELMANALIPTAFVSVASLLVANKRNIIKIPALLSALVLGSYVGMVTAEKSQRVIGEKIDSIDLNRLKLK